MFPEEESLRRMSDEEIYTEGQKQIHPDRPIWLYSINIIKEQRKAQADAAVRRSTETA